MPLHSYTSTDIEGVEHLSNVIVKPLEGKIEQDGKVIFQLEIPPKVQQDILKAGGLFEYAKTV